MGNELDKKMVGVLCIALILFAVALYNLMTQSTNTIREGDILTVRMERGVGGPGVPEMVIKKKKLDPSPTSWTYHILIEEIRQDSVQTNITYYYDGKYRKEDSGTLTLKQSHPTNLSIIWIRINSIDSEKARIIIKLRS